MRNINSKELEVVLYTENSKAERFKDELNFAEFPLASLADHVPNNQKTLTFNDTIIDKSLNKPVTRKLTIMASDQYGLPRALDEEVILGLIQISNRQGFKDKKVHFSSYELIKLLGWSDSTKSYKRIEEALNRWISITLFYDKAWWSKQEQCWVNEKFHILESVTIYDKERRANSRKLKANDENAGRSYFVWNEKVFESFIAGNLKEIDLDIYKSLKSSISKRMYRFLDKRFYHRSNLDFDLSTFAYEHIGVSRQSPLAEVKRLFSKPILELENIGFIKPLPKDERFLKIKKGIYSIVFEKGQSDAKNLMSDEEAKVLDELQSRGVTSGKASKLVRSYPASRVLEKIAIHDWMLSTKDKRCSSNPAGFLVNAIENDYQQPKGFLKSREEAKSGLKVVNGSQIKRAVKPKVECEVPKPPSALEVEFDNWWASLSEEEQIEFEKLAVSQAKSFARNFYKERSHDREGVGFRAMQRSILLAWYEGKKVPT
ncbi:MAG TPA: replication initiator protein A [Oligoflexia bacterium]|nr:replication initiator protein A [Oligoflexia bacterium]HMP49748.1 replication initiator protein A [Oligoflexia bacterium]